MGSMMNWSANERRRHARVEQHLCAWISFQASETAHGTLTVDLGAQGAQFSTLRSVEVSEPVLVCLQFPSGSIECKGRVCWTNWGSNGLNYFGVRFLDLSESERDRLEHYVDHRSRLAVAR
jgi:hypothetical protein